MKHADKLKAITLRNDGRSLSSIATELNVAKSSVSLWVRNIALTNTQKMALKNSPFTNTAIEKRLLTRLRNEIIKRQLVIDEAFESIEKVMNVVELRRIGTALYWAEGGKTQRMVRFSNGDPEMIILIMKYFRIACIVPEEKFRGYIHIHPHLDVENAEKYWSSISGIPRNQFFKTYNKINISSKNTRDTLPFGVFDVYVMDTKLFLKIEGWIKAIVKSEII